MNLTKLTFLLFVTTTLLAGCGGRLYDAYPTGGGPRCGLQGSTHLTCMPGDRCVDEANSLCELVASGRASQ